MAALTDEILMAYADGELDGEGRALVEAHLEWDTDAKWRLEAFRSTGEALAHLYQQPMYEPVPRQLTDFVMQYGRQQPARAKRVQPKASFVSWLEKFLPQPVAWQLAAASTAALVIGLSAGWFLHGTDGASTGDQLVAFEGGRIYASDALSRVLEQEPSRHDARISGGAGEAVVMRASLTFKDKNQRYCREYEIATPGGKGFVGLACRTGEGKWAVQVHVASSVNTPGKVIPADGSRPEALDAIVDRLIDGDALGRDDEAAVIANGWK